MLLALLFGMNAFGQIEIATTSPVSQNFNTIGATATASLPANWKISPPGVASPTWAATGNFTATTQTLSSSTPTPAGSGGRYNWGSGTDAADRAIGFMTSGSYASPNSIMAQYKNTNVSPLTKLTVSYDVERYRINVSVGSASLFYSLNGTTWTAVPAGDLTFTTVSSSANSAYGFPYSTLSATSVEISNLNIATDGVIYLRWQLTTGASNAQGLGLDNVSVTGTFTASASPALTVSGALAHGTSCVNTAANYVQYTITNNGTVAASGVTVTSNNSEFVVSNAPVSIAANGGTATYRVIFTPSATGSRSGTITIASTTSGSNSVTNLLTGTGVTAAAPGVTASLTSVNASQAVIDATTTITNCSGVVNVYGVEYSTSSGFADGTGNPVTGSGINGGAFSVTIPSLNPATTYYYKVYAQNSTGRTYTAQSSFTTACAALALPLLEGFEGTTFPPTCWARFNGENGLGATTGTTIWNRFTGSPYAGIAAASVQPDNVTNGLVAQDWLVTPGLTIPAGNNSSLKFYIRPSGTDNLNTSKFFIKISTGSQTVYNTFTNVETYTAGTFESTGEYYEKIINLSSYAGQTIYIAFVAESDNGLTWGIDGIEIRQLKSEPSNQPTNTTCGTATHNSTTVSFTAAAGPVTADGYIVKWSATSFDAITPPVDGVAEVNGSGVLNVTGTSAFLTGLSAYTNYFIKIWSYSNSGVVINYNLVNPLQTNCATTEGPCLSEAFTTTTPTGWLSNNITYISRDGSVVAEFAAASGLGDLTTAALTNPKTLSFDLVRTTNATAKTLYVEVSTTSQNTGFTTIATYDHNNTVQTNNNPINLVFSEAIQASTSVWVRFRKQSGTASPWRIDNVAVSCIGTTVFENSAWSPAAPDNTKIAIIKSAYDTAEHPGFAALNLTIAPTGSINISSGKTITVANGVTNNSTLAEEGFKIENNGALVQTNTAANSGAIKVIKNSNPLYRLDYTLWSSPVSGALNTLGAFSPNTTTGRFYEYKYAHDAAANNGAGGNIEQYFIVPPTTAFEAAKGYLIRMPNGNSAPGYNAGTAAITFEGKFIGEPHNGTVNIPASIQGNRYTAVGNPYPSPINVVDFFTANSNVIDTASGIYFWRKRNGAAASYSTLTLAAATSPVVYTPNPSGGQPADQAGYFSGPSSEWIISQGQGFIVKTKAAPTGTNITFTNSMRKAAPASGNQAFFRTSAQSQPSRLWINLTNSNNGFSQAAVAYLENATTGIDYGYDGRQLADNNNVLLYTLSENINLAVQARPEFNAADVVQMGFTVANAGEYTLAMDHTDGVFSNGQTVYLKDSVTGLTYNLSDGAYTFTTTEGTFNQRFEVVFTTQALGTDAPLLNANSVIVYKQGNTLNINSASAEITAVTVYDIRGRKLYANTNINSISTTINDLQAAHEVIVVEINTVKGTINKKVVY